MPLTHDLFVAVWKVKPVTTANLSLIDKGVKMTAAAEGAYAFMKGASARMGAKNPVYLFVAPEYYWVKDSKLTPYDAAEKNTIYSALQGTSAGKKKLLMFPGTVNWQVPKAQYGGATTGPIQTRANVAQYACPVYLGGNLLLDYHKKYNDKILDGNSMSQVAFGAGPDNAAQSFTSGNLRFGLDICGDLNEGKLSLTLGQGTVDVMVLTAGSMAHMFNKELIQKIPVREGGAFIHCDNSGKADRNGVWVVTRQEQGWHGSHREENTFTFQDIDNVKRTLAFPVLDAEVPGSTMKVSNVGGTVHTEDIDATVTEKSRGYVRKFTLTLPGNSPQSAYFEKNGDDYDVQLSRGWFSAYTHRKAKLVSRGDLHGMSVTARGNVSKIGRLLGEPGVEDLDCYSLPIET